MAKSARRTAAPRSRRPIMRLLELLGRRWTLRILWELRGEPLHFRALQTACGGLSPSVLNRRLAELREARLVEAGGDGYRLTALGRELGRHVMPLVAWSQRWGRSNAEGR
jgi:DNA-binding HxlR family transcriptional regulator